MEDEAGVEVEADHHTGFPDQVPGGWGGPINIPNEAVVLVEVRRRQGGQGNLKLLVYEDWLNVVRDSG